MIHTIIVECKKKNRKDGKGQLEDYLRFSKANLDVWFNGDEEHGGRLFLRKIEKEGKVLFEEIPNIPVAGQRVEMTHSQLSQVRIFVPEKKSLESIIDKVKNIVKYNREALELIEEAKGEFLEIVKLKTKAAKEKYFSGDFKTLTEFDIWNPTCHLPFYIENENKLKRSFKTMPLGQVADIKKGSEAGSNNYGIYLWRKETDYAFIRTSDIINNEIDLFPDYFIPSEIVSSFNQDLKTGDILFTKDGKIGQTAMVTENDKALIASGVSRIRIKSEIVKQHKFTQEYLFICLSVKQTGYNPAIRRTVIGTTIPHLREERMKQISIPILQEEQIKSLTEKIKIAFKLKSERKKLINEVLKQIDNEYEKFRH
ncbi:MAG: restriction endonuclease subunit S [Bacteroidia bacterium]|nr:restriction endonuclease subunit S [Bacteroidia bacterium]